MPRFVTGPDRRLRKVRPCGWSSTRLLGLRRRFAGVPVLGYVSIAGNAGSGIGTQPHNRWRHHFGLNEVLAFEAGLIRDHQCIGRTTGYNDIHGNARAFELLRVPARHRFQPRLARAVWVKPTAQHRKEAGRDVDDAPPALIEQMRYGRACEIPGTRHIHCDEALPDIGLDLLNANQTGHVVISNSAHSHCTVVNQNVQTTQFVEHIANRHQPGDVVLVMSNGSFGNIWEKLLGALKASA